MKDLKLGADGDIDLTSGDFEIIDNAKQAIVIRLKWFRGEWSINREYGVPYYDDILGQKFGSGTIEEDIYDVIYSVKDVRTVENVDLSFAGRILKIAFSAICNNGAIESGEVAI